MPDLSFRVVGAEPERSAAVPMLVFQLCVADAATEATPVYSVALRCQLRIEPGRRRYTDTEKERLLDLFGTPDRWGQTVRPMTWTHVSAVVPPFTGETAFDLPVPCSSDFSLAATKYFAAMEGGELPLGFQFSGTIFYESAEGRLQVTQIPWDREASYRLPVTTWHRLMELYYPNCAWLCLRKEVFERFDRYRSLHGLPTAELALEQLLAADREAVPT